MAHFGGYLKCKDIKLWQACKPNHAYLGRWHFHSITKGGKPGDCNGGTYIGIEESIVPIKAY